MVVVRWLGDGRDRSKGWARERRRDVDVRMAKRDGGGDNAFGGMELMKGLCVVKMVVLQSYCLVM